MPLEIRELVIKVKVNEGGNGADPQAGRGGQSVGQGENKKAIIAECLEQVMDILQKKKER
ncbi:MAG: DUF5908 family protein [Saprospiraceae bacterium]|nr:DUF5908 family protein [Saprospiraceae bacterium]MCF8249982.1 DUF5908 family protein [Saprospiraceae bacterium]MCF8278978.1 DUF5908 family protein [Bacteroidales bacterium]MCF8310995.1 DUF5908 family protein [Saprospiraceae bacterium]MCF8439669.1 DUF5908 family protein [Saprospiraceae bacterium]